MPVLYRPITLPTGKPMTELMVTPAGPEAVRGTRVVFRPDPEIFKTTTDFEFDKLAGRLDELAYLNAGLTLKVASLF